MITIPSYLSHFLRSPRYFRFSSKGFVKPISDSLLAQSQSTSPESIIRSIIFSISSCASVSYCQAIHARVVKSVHYTDGFIGDRLVSLYTKLCRVDDAHKLFNELPKNDLVSWNSLVSGMSQKGYVDKCLSVFCRMRSEMGMQPNEVTLLSIVSACTNKEAAEVGKYVQAFAVKNGLLSEAKVVNSLINMYGKLGYLDAACRLFEEMPNCNVVSWNSMVVIQTQNGFSEEGIIYFILMRRAGIKPDQATMVALLLACADLGVLKQAEVIHGYIFSSGLNTDERTSTGLISLYAKLGRLNASREVFGEMKHADKIAWTAMLASYATHGCGRKAIELFERMVKEGVKPDHVTFTHLLSACSHSGLVVEGNKYFEIMSKAYGVERRLDHYSCMVDLLGRAGFLKDAYELIENMPMEPSSGVWGALLGACRVYRNIALGKDVAERLIALNPEDPRNYIMLSNIYSAAGLWRDASKARALMKERSLVQNPGCSFIEHGNKIHRFIVSDRSHPESDKIYIKLEELIRKIREAGIVPKTEFVLHDVEDEVKEDMINKHSEKLAIAFGLLVTGAGTPLIITKNLRICGDCHSTAKAISLIEKRTITIRDSKRFHHFADGLCSCGDYW